MDVSMGRKVLISVGLAAVLVGGAIGLFYILGGPSGLQQPEGSPQGGRDGPTAGSSSGDGSEELAVSSPLDTAAGATGQIGGEGDETGEKEAPEGPVALHGRVVDLEDSPVAGARVYALHKAKWDEGLVMVQGKLSRARGPFEAVKGLREAVDEAVRKLPRTESDREGRYAFRELPKGEYRLFVTHQEHLPNLETWAFLESEDPVEADVRLVDGYSISGRVVDESGAPVAGASLSALPSDQSGGKGMGQLFRFISSIFEGNMVLGIGETTSGADGSFRLSSLEPVPHEVRVKSPGFADRTLTRVPAGTSSLLVNLDRGGIVTGRVLGPDREVLPGVRATARPRLPSDIERNPVAMFQADIDFLGERDIEVTTGTDGRFVMSGLADGEYEFAILSDSHPRHDDAIEPSAATPLDLGDIVLERSLSISGEVRGPDGKLVPDARVWIDPPRPEGRSRFEQPVLGEAKISEARTNSDGRFTLEGIREGTYTVLASAPDLSDARAEGVAAGATDLELVLPLGVSIAGIVKEAGTGRPIRGATVNLLSADERGETDADGAFEIHGITLREGSGSPAGLIVQVQHPDYNPLFRPLQEVPGGELELELTPLNRVIGFVVDPDGNPVKSARVRVHFPGMPEMLTMLGPGGGQGMSSFSAGDGSFAVHVPDRNFGPGGNKIEIVASHPLWAGGRTEYQKGAPEVEIVLSAGATLDGRVVDPGGQPVPGAVIRYKRSEKMEGEAALFASMLPSSAGRAEYSGPDGLYRLSRLEPGTYDFEVVSMGYAKRIEDGVVVNDGEQRRDFVLDPGASLSGRVVDDMGQPLRGVEVVAVLEQVEPSRADDPRQRMLDEMRAMMLLTEKGVGQARTDAAGQYDIRNLPDGVFRLVARASGFLPAQQPGIRPSGSIPDLVLTRFAALAGTVVDARSLEPVPEFRINALPADESESLYARFGFSGGREVKDPAGAFRLEGLEPLQYEVAVQAEAYVPHVTRVSLVSGETHTLKVRLEEGYHVNVVAVLEPTGEPVPGVRVYRNRSQAQEERSEALRRLRYGGSSVDATAQDGVFVVRGLDEGKYSISVRDERYYAEKSNQTVEIPRDHGGEIVFRLRPAGQLRGTIADIPRVDAQREGYFLVIEGPGTDGAIADRPEVLPTDSASAESPEKATPKPAAARSTQQIWINPNDGSFRAESLKPGTYVISLKRQVYRRPEEESAVPAADVQGDENIPIGTVEIQAGRTETVQVSFKQLR